MPDIHMVDAEGVYRALETRETGLTRAEARKRLREHGPNEIRQTRRRPLYREFVAQFTHFLAGLLWIAAGLCFLSEYMRPGEGMLSLGLAIVGVIAVNAVFTFVQEYRAEKAVDALRKLLPFRVKVLREGAVREVPSRDVVPGDVFHLAEGDRVPADARVLSSDRLSVNMAPLTGESEPMPRDAAPSEEDLHESANVVLAGTLVVGGSGAAAAFATGMDTEFGRIAHLTGTVHPGRTPLQKEILKTTRVIAVIALTTGASFFILGILTGRGFWHNFIFAVGIIVANVPEGLLPTVTLSLAMASQRMARKNALIKTLPSVETLGSVTVICTDKTGTLTQNRMEVREAWSPEGAKAEMLHLAAGLCNDASRADGRYVGEPTEVALLKASEARCGTHAARREYDIPFSPEKKRMTTVDVVDGSRYVFAKGAVEAILASCGDAAEGGAHRRLIEERSRAMMDRGLRVIAFGWKECRGQAPYTDGSLEGGLSFAGLMGLEDPPRPEVPEAVRKCREAGIKVIMITGDASRTALSVARAVGLAAGAPAVVEGPELSRMDDAGLARLLAGEEIIFARMTPRHKMRVVSALQDMGERVAVTGDGVNDAPALKKADIGIAMGVAGTDVAREAADMVLLDDNFATIVAAVEEGRAVFENIRKFITYIFAHLTPEAVPYIMFALLKIPLPLTVMQILAIDLGTETLPALALGVEPPEGGVMAVSPRKERRIIDRGVIYRSYLFLGLLSAAGVMAVYFYVLCSGGWAWGDVLPAGHPLARRAATATFLGIVLFQVGNVFACRSAGESVFRLGFFSNRLIVAGIAAELALAALIVYHPLGNKIFDTAPVGADVWLMLVPMAAAALAADEARKYLRRRRAPA